jgi:hypothetical protein
VPVRVFLVSLFSLVPLTGCFTVSGASSNAIPAVKVQASSDLDCPQKEIQVTKEWGGRFEVQGCGHRGVYNTACDGLRCTAAPLGQTVPWGARPDPTPSGTECANDERCSAR